MIASSTRKRCGLRFCLLSSVFCLLSSALVAADQPPLYTIEKEQVDKDGRPQDRIFLARRPGKDGSSTLYVTVEFKIGRADGQAALDVAPDEHVVNEKERRVDDLEVHTPAASEPHKNVLV
jgi:hypothetical protein